MTERKMSKEEERWIAERGITLQLLRNDHPGRWARAELEREVEDIEPLTVSDALAALEAEGVVVLDGEHVEASPCARRLDTLDLISI
jgi:DNA-binding HxlR family transcriptional regulator